jgi:GNAT superfamily N-acetyltransferase
MDSAASAAQLAVLAIAPGVIASIRQLDEDDISFDYLGVPPEARGQGIADAAIALVGEHADAEDLTVWMQPDNAFGADMRRLIPWYSRHGYVPVAGAEPFTMRRTPRMSRETETFPILEMPK